jgi:hypothetical protein
MNMSRKQQQRQQHREHGKYAKVNPCYCCGKSAGIDYCSHPMTDCTDSDGKAWGDTGLCLCQKCFDATKDMVLVADFIAYVAKKKQGGQP